jgi:hypothetical protein
MRRSVAVAVAAATGAALTPILVAQTSADAPAVPAAPPAVSPVQQLPVIVATKTVVPQRTMRLESRFRPPAFPTPSYVLGVIAKHEAARWGAPYWRLRCRIFGESGGKWTSTNGQYAGIGQFAWSTYARGVRSIGSRRVEVTTRRVRLRKVRIVERLSDGTTRRRFGRPVRQVVELRRVGVLPRDPAYRHAWVQARIMARALVGLGAVNDSEWSVRC